MLKRIPKGNNVLENEVDYLQNQYQNGYKFVRKGLFFYRFDKVTPAEATYEIDLLPQDTPSEYLQIPDWELVFTKQMLFKNLKRVYYVSATDNRLLVDQEMRLQYYKRQTLIWEIAFVASLLMFMLHFSPQFVDITNSLLNDILSSFGLAFFSLIISVPRMFLYARAVESVQIRLGQQTEALPIHYTIRFSNLSDHQLEGIAEKLSLLGSVKQVDDRFFRLKSLMGKEKLLEEIISVTDIQEENINLLHPMDMWFPM